ncbi:MAG: protein kinase [Bacteroidales bacterium]|nr:protein kinase [Bacteroidales bacterium]
MSNSTKYNIINKLKTRNPNEKVYVGNRVGDSKNLIIKSFNNNSQSSVLSYLRESSVNIEHKNICKLIDSFQNEDYSFVIREHIEGVDLQDFTNKQKYRRKANLEFYLKVFVEVLEGLKELHSQKIIHRDIRPANILLNSNSFDKEYFIKPKVQLIDFGMAKSEKLELIDNMAPFALIFSPPEQVLRFVDLTNETSDIYAVGMSLWITLNNKLPFNHQIPEVVANLQLTQNLPKTRKITQEVFNIIQKSTYKIELKKPPNKYSKIQLREMFIEAQKHRFQTADEMIDAILKIGK